MAWHLHLNPGTPNSLLTNAFLIISVINVSYCAIRLISHMQSSDHLEQGAQERGGRGKKKKWDKRAERTCPRLLCVISTPRGNKAHLQHSHFSCGWVPARVCAPSRRRAPPQLCFGICAWPSHCWIAAWLFQIWGNIQTRPVMHSSIWFSRARTAVQQLSMPCWERDRFLCSINRRPLKRSLTNEAGMQFVLERRLHEITNHLARADG